VTLRLNAKQAHGFLNNIRHSENKIRSYIKRRCKDPRSDPLPQRDTGPSAEEIAAAKTYLDSHYHLEPQNIPLKDIEPGLLLAALYNNAQTGGMGIGHYQNTIMHPTEAKYILAEVARSGALPEFDTLNGRSIKTHFKEQNGKWFVGFTRFWDYNNLPIVVVIEAARTGHYTRLSGQGILDTKNEASILLDRILQRRDHDKVKTLTALHEEATRRLSLQQSQYVMAHRNALRQTPSFVISKSYQLSIGGNGPLTGEIGHLIKPYKAVSLATDTSDHRDDTPEQTPRL